MYKLNLDDIMPNMELDQDIFTDIGGTAPLLRKGAKFTPIYLYRLKQRGIKELFVAHKMSGLNDGDKNAAAGQLENRYARLNVPVEKAKLTVAPKLKDESIRVMKELHISISGKDAEAVSAVITQVGRLVNRLLASVMDADDLVNISNLRRDNDLIYGHSLSVAVLSVAIGQYMRLGRKELLKLGESAMLHDIGKYMIPDEILKKPSSLTGDEMEIIRKHPLYGYNYLKTRNMADENVLHGIAFHHEREDGTGYPYGLAGEKIPKWSKIISVADVYEAMTAPRPYRPALSPAEAYEYIAYNVNIAFDKDVVNAFMKKVDFYPMGSFVELSNGAVAVVLHTKNKLRPVVQLMQNNNIVDLAHDMRYLNVVIDRVVPYAEVLALAL